MLPNTNGMTTAEAAIAIAASGFNIFPCHSGQSGTGTPKTPMVKWKDWATANPDKVKHTWPVGAHKAIGLPTGSGQIAIDGMVPIVIDVDVKNGIDGNASIRKIEVELGPLPDTYTVETPSGGSHQYFLVPAAVEIGNSASKLGAGIDVRGDGGYVIAAGSELHGIGRYTVINPLPVAELPSAWLDRLTQRIKPRGTGKRAATSATQPAKHQAGGDTNFTALEDEAITVRNAAPGERNDVLNKAAFQLGKHVAAGELTEQDVIETLTNACIENDLVHEDGIESVEATIKSGLGAGIAEPLPLNEDRLAVIFAERYEKKLAFDHTRGKWFCWDGSIWREDRLEQSLMAARELIREETKGVPKDLNKTGTARAVLRAASADPKLAINHEGWNSDPWLLGVPDGVINLTSGELLDPDPSLRINMSTSVTPADPGTPCPKWRSFIDEVTCGDPELARYIQQGLGYILTGCTHEEIFFFLYGNGGNGKGVLISAFGAIMGDYAKSAPMETFMASKGERHLTELARLSHARLVTASETEEGRSLAVARIKELTGNERPITANFMRRDHFEFSPRFKLVLVGNNKPKIPSVDNAMKRRLRLLPFINVPKEPNLNLKNDLEGEYPAILRWAIDGTQDWQKNGFVTPRCVLGATKEYFEEEDIRSQWLADRVIQEANGWESSKDLFEDWEQYARCNGCPVDTSTMLSRWLKKQGFKDGKSAGRRGIVGLKLKPKATDFDESSPTEAGEQRDD